MFVVFWNVREGFGRIEIKNDFWNLCMEINGLFLYLLRVTLEIGFQ
jgi:hypothetical protein